MRPLDGFYFSIRVFHSNCNFEIFRQTNEQTLAWLALEEQVFFRGDLKKKVVVLDGTYHKAGDPQGDPPPSHC